MKYFKPTNVFYYSNGPLSMLALLLALLFLWYGGVYGREDWGFSSDLPFIFKVCLSLSVVYISWMFFLSFKKYPIEIDETRVKIPSIWLPGIVFTEMYWKDIKDIRIGVKRGYHGNPIEILVFKLSAGKEHKLYSHAIRAKRCRGKPCDTFYQYISKVVNGV